MDQTNNKFYQTCNKHSQNQITFLKVISDQRDSSIFYCIDCVNEDLSFKGIEHVLIPQIVSQSEKNIIQKWPPVNDYSILEKLSKEISNENFSISAIQQINNFFEELKVEIIKKIDFCQKKMINQALNLPLGKEQILNKYKEISQIETLKQILGNYQDQFESQEIKCRAFLSEIESKKEENTQQLQNLLEQCQRKKELINFEKSMTIRQSIYTLIDSINFFPNDSNQFNQSNINPLNNQRLSNTQKIIELVSNKSNFCSQEFLEQLRVNQEYLDAIFNQISFENMFQQNKQPIRFQQLNNQKFEEINEYIDHLIKLQNDQIYNQQIQSSELLRKIFQVVDSKINFISSDVKISLKDIFVQIYPLLNKLGVQEIFNSKQEFELVKNISEVMLQDFILILKKKQEINIQNTYHQSISNFIKQQVETKFPLLERNDLDRILLNFPVFDVVKTNKQIDILKNFEMIKTKYNDGNERIQIIKNLNSTCEIFINEQQYFGIFKGQFSNCISSNILENDKKYIFRIQLEVTDQNQHNFYIGLMQKSQSDLISGDEQNLSCKFKKRRGQFEHFIGLGIDQYKKGNKLVYQDNFKFMLELRVWLGGQVLQILDYPKYEYQLELEDKFKNKLIKYDDLCLYLYLFEENRKYIIKEAYQVDQFDF
ncbi:hypothetical protein TTHERM_01217230 (macronuclear) [Tetrahymena thermophila SB210]|uniref:Zinc carboxypeptidase family protein n=1 Tax=Tetrahymena thermophila (strain SB210) TaxID=312017 RepID=Q22WM3_TETTS|nr:hypothetical protein TTHERM_01217230 [Tetrahymena thermophila SB210]EAR89679.2 hypothetical protein TTHERM_01217230 [Tetrahymena thermophila SB210]|eukprot:XP_001009924.2 hypothetical protein TTHERM_01217230 [Tetrahymena thermophila SB210]